MSWIWNRTIWKTIANEIPRQGTEYNGNAEAESKGGRLVKKRIIIKLFKVLKKKLIINYILLNLNRPCTKLRP